MPDLLLSGPAGAGKSQLAAELRAELAAAGFVVSIVDFQSIYVAITGDVRDPTTGRYPLRDERLLPLIEYARRAITTGAVEMGVTVVATNSDGSPERRAELLGRLAPGATETVIDPGRAVVERRLSDHVDPDGEGFDIDFGDDDGDGRRRGGGRISRSCRQATNRWYNRLGGGRGRR